MSKGKRPLGRQRRRWVDLLEVDWDGVDWIGLAQDRDKWRALVNAVMSLRVPYKDVKLSSGYTIGGLSSSSQFHRVS
jgi:GH18 family chitinase